MRLKSGRLMRGVRLLFRWGDSRGTSRVQLALTGGWTSRVRSHRGRTSRVQLAPTGGWTSRVRSHRGADIESTLPQGGGHREYNSLSQGGGHREYAPTGGRTSRVRSHRGRTSRVQLAPTDGVTGDATAVEHNCRGHLRKPSSSPSHYPPSSASASLACALVGSSTRACSK